jgi:adenylate kinase
MEPYTFIFFGRSGSGKGTQAKLLIDFLKKSTPNTDVLYIETGQRFREFASEASLSAKKTKEIMGKGGLLPEFLPIWIWTEYLVRHVSGGEHMVLDGLSRRSHEAPILDSAMRFYERKKPFVISINVRREVAKERLLGRQRSDDKEEDIEKRLDWYDKNVLPAIEYFKQNPYYQFVEIDADRPVEEVHKDILENTILAR